MIQAVLYNAESCKLTTAVCSSGCHAVGGYCNNPGQCLYVFLVANNSTRPTSTQIFILIYGTKRFVVMPIMHTILALSRFNADTFLAIPRSIVVYVGCGLAALVLIIIMMAVLTIVVVTVTCVRKKKIKVNGMYELKLIYYFNLCFIQKSVL